MKHKTDLTKEFLAWVLEHGALCECCAADGRLMPVRELAGILLGMREQLDDDVILFCLSLSPDRARQLAALPGAPPGSGDSTPLIDEIHGLMPHVRACYEAWLIDEKEIFRPVRRGRCRPLARMLKQTGFDGRVGRVDVRRARVSEIAAELRRMHHHPFALILERAGLIARAHGPN